VITILDELLSLPQETEWVEFKYNNNNPTEIGEYIAAIANSAALLDKNYGYLVWGIQNETHRVIGTTFKPRQEKKGNESLENWLTASLSPQINFTINEFKRENSNIVIFTIPKAVSETVKFKGIPYIRVGSHKKKLNDHPEKEKELWRILNSSTVDWSATILESASLEDLDSEAILFARKQYAMKNPKFSEELDTWDDITFLNKAKLCKNGKITISAMILLGKETSSYFLSPAQAHITWIFKDDNNMEKDYQHFSCPLIMASDLIQKKIRNNTIRHMPNGSLFPVEIKQYDSWVIRETLHNCIAHQDYSMQGKISVIETSSSLTFTNLGTFIPGSVTDMIKNDVPPDIYRNYFLTNAMVNLNMIDTIGSGIKKMFSIQKSRSFPLPEYDLFNSKPEKVKVRIDGNILDENYTKYLLQNQDLDIFTVIALDKVQKGHALTEIEFKGLKKLNLVEGRRPNLFVSSQLLNSNKDKVAYIKNRAFDKKHYKKLIISYLEKYNDATRADLDALIMDKLSDALGPIQRKHFITNLLQEMRLESLVCLNGTTRWGKWVISKNS
jgi:ATP-dependent DNA helicase RecG